MTGIVPEIAPADRLQTANGLLRMGTNSARILGFAVAGGLVALLGPGLALTVNAATCLASEPGGAGGYPLAVPARGHRTPCGAGGHPLAEPGVGSHGGPE
jgi:hypothetical protein